MKKSKFWLVTLMFVFALMLAACGKDSASSSTESSSSSSSSASESSSEAPSEPKSGGTVTYAVDNAPEGVLDPAFSGSATDSDVQEFSVDGMFAVGDDLKTVPHIASWTISEDKLTYTFTIQKGVKWHDGEELTVEDWKYALEVLADKEYTGPRYNYVQGVKGAEDYHAGKAETISGIEVVDPYTMKVTFKQVQINNIDNLWPTPMPKKYYAGVAVKDLGESPQVRQKPVGLGPFKVKSVKAGEYVELERFDDYWQGKALLDKVIIKVIDPALAAGALQNGDIDVMGIRPAALAEIGKLDNVRVEESNGVSYSFVGLRFGHRINEKSVMDFHKFDEQKLRQALLYAINRPAMIEAFLVNKATVANTVIPTTFWVAADPKDLNAYEFNPDKAKQLLTEAGYKDTNGDGFVEDPQGKEFKISFGHYAGPAAFEGRSKAIMQSWNDIGVKTELATGALVEFNLYNEMKDKDDPALEAFFGSWSVGSDPDPTGLWGSDSLWNYGRWVNAESDRLIAEGVSPKAFDDTYRKQVYVDWQKLFNDQLPALPLWENKDLYAINKRLQGVHVNALTEKNNVHKWYVTQ